jgi:protein-histidine pros-kinase
MKPWWRDTLFKRLFVLIWLCLIVSHLVAFLVVTRVALPGGAHPAPSHPPIGALGTLPPTPGLPNSHGPVAHPGNGLATAGPMAPLPLGALLLDYGIRAVLIGVAAWFGARWISTPMRRLVGASKQLTTTLSRNQPVPRLDDKSGTVEVREAARVFNSMADRLHHEFRARGLLMASISHDLRTPLTRMRMRLEALAPGPAAVRCIEDIREMNDLIDNAMQVFRGPEAEEPMQSTDVFALVQSLADDLVEQGRDVTVIGGSVVAPVQPVALKRAVSNLVGNALRYGGSAQVTVVTIDGLRVLIDDHGPGIPAGELEAVFEPFVRLETSRSRETGGSGLGLHIARDLLQRQGATLSLSNRDGGGLRAEIRLASA